MHAAVFAAVAFIAPSLGATEEEPFDRDRILLMQSLLNASAQHEQESKPDDSAPSSGGDVNAGAPTRGAEGEAGKETADDKNARWAARGSATPENATLARENALKEAAAWGLIGMLPSSTQALDAPTLPWGTVLNGSDDVNKVGHLFGGSMDDAFGTGGWGLSGPGEGAGGTADAIGLNGLGGLGHTGKCLGTELLRRRRGPRPDGRRVHAEGPLPARGRSHHHQRAPARPRSSSASSARTSGASPSATRTA